MKANMAPFLSLLGASNVLYVVPVYQRRYTWDEEDCRVLWDDIMRAGKQRKPHFIGSVLHIPEGESTITGTKRHLLIDGQQRMTTVSLLMEAFIEYLEKNPERAGFLTEVRVPALRKIYLYNDDDYNGDARYKLSLSQEDRATLHSIVASTAPPKGLFTAIDRQPGKLQNMDLRKSLRSRDSVDRLIEPSNHRHGAYAGHR